MINVILIIINILNIYRFIRLCYWVNGCATKVVRAESACIGGRIYKVQYMTDFHLPAHASVLLGCHWFQLWLLGGCSNTETMPMHYTGMCPFHCDLLCLQFREGKPLRTAGNHLQTWNWRGPGVAGRKARKDSIDATGQSREVVQPSVVITPLPHWSVLLWYRWIVNTRGLLWELIVSYFVHKIKIKIYVV